MSTRYDLCPCGRRKQTNSARCWYCEQARVHSDTARVNKGLARAFDCPERQARIAVYTERAGRGEELFQGERS